MVNCVAVGYRILLPRRREGTPVYDKYVPMENVGLRLMVQAYMRGKSPPLIRSRNA